MSAIDLSLLPAPDVVEVIDYEVIYAQRKARLISLYPADQQAGVEKILALDSEPMAIMLQENAYRETILRQRVNDAARATMLASCFGADLDQRAANVNLLRLVVIPADNTTTPPTPALMETDESLRERVQLAYEGMSVAGPTNAYIKHARDADGRVADASAISPAPCEVVVTILYAEGNGSIPDGSNLTQIVDAALSDDDVRPLGDRLTVQGATIIEYVVDMTLFFSTSGPENEISMAAAQARVDAYRTERRRLGRSVTRAALIAAAKVEGVEDVQLASPAANIKVEKTEAAFCTGVTINDGGEFE